MAQVGYTSLREVRQRIAQFQVIDDDGEERSRKLQPTRTAKLAHSRGRVASRASYDSRGIVKTRAVNIASPGPSAWKSGGRAIGTRRLQRRPTRCANEPKSTTPTWLKRSLSDSKLIWTWVLRCWNCAAGPLTSSKPMLKSGAHCSARGNNESNGCDRSSDTNGSRRKFAP